MRIAHPVPLAVALASACMMAAPGVANAETVADNPVPIEETWEEDSPPPAEDAPWDASQDASGSESVDPSGPDAPAAEGLSEPSTTSAGCAVAVPSGRGATPLVLFLVAGFMVFARRAARGEGGRR